MRTDSGIEPTDALNACIPDPRHPFFVVHSQRTLLAQRVFGIAQGYEDLNDHQGLREDPWFQVLCERGIQEDLPLASPPTLCRLENRVDRKALARMAEVFVEVFIRSQTSAPKELILDFDPTNDPVHGNQEQRLFGEFRYGAQTWDRKRRGIVKAEHVEPGPNTRFLVTNLAGGYPLKDLFVRILGRLLAVPTRSPDSG
ncbi:MAG: transposase [Phycisphaerae bacterium]|nr:transposase [Phycisphaerae bacterium]